MLAAALKERLFDTRCEWRDIGVMVLYLSFCATVVVIAAVVYMHHKGWRLWAWWGFQFLQFVSWSQKV
ncbi:hypothetical protein SPFM12_00092 [Salmonella phage SPFM12]|nr:hypothetical protein SPFM12_00092 [Salmonella phage SPFM12]